MKWRKHLQFLCKTTEFKIPSSGEKLEDMVLQVRNKTLITWGENRVLTDPPIIDHASHEVSSEKALKDSPN